MGQELQTTEGGFMTMIERLAASPDFDAGKLEKLIDMQERVMNKNAEISFNQALSRISGRIPRIKRTANVKYADKNGNLKEAFKFAPYEEIDTVIRPLLAEEGFSLSFTSEPRQGDGGGLLVTGTLSHKEGHSKSASIPLALDSSGGKNNIQGMGSTFSYGKRYTACMLLNIVTEGDDDDGESHDNGYIDEAQVETIERMIVEAKANHPKFLSYMGVKLVTEIRQRDYDKAIMKLNEKKASNARS